MRQLQTTSKLPRCGRSRSFISSRSLGWTGCPDAGGNILSVSRFGWPKYYHRLLRAPYSGGYFDSLTGEGLVLFQHSQFLPVDPSQPAARKGSKPCSSAPRKNEEDLPYYMELWNEARTAVEQVLAMTANASIGYSAFYAAARDHFDRYVTLR